MDINVATRKYEQWLAKRIPVVRVDLERKHRQMRKEPFRFLRATYYRWLQVREGLGKQLPVAPRILAVGDLHIENFGTWRDREGRLIWGINDFDEADVLPCTDDLIRLVCSAILARTIGRMRLRPVDICEAVLLGYDECLAEGGLPFVLAEEHHWLREAAMNDLRDPVPFWKKLAGSRERAQAVPSSARSILRSALPASASTPRITRRSAGVGSLGRPRYLATLRWNGSWIAREVKAVVPSALSWVTGRDRPVRYTQILRSAVRCPDPFVDIRNGWLVRRLAPDCSRIELETLPRRYDEYRLMHAMGWETANIHIGGAAPRDLRAHLRRLDRDWLPSAAEVMLEALHEDWRQYRRRR
jgi:hypothetical protein